MEALYDEERHGVVLARLCGSGRLGRVGGGEQLMRYFFHYHDDTLQRNYQYEDGELVGRKPLIISFDQLKHKRKSAQKSVWIKKAQALLRRMEL